MGSGLSDQVTSEKATNKMGIFGDLDIDNIPDDPFKIPAGTYKAVCTDAKFQEKDGNHSLVITWSVDDPETSVHGNNISKWYSLFPGVKETNLSPEQIRTLSFLKKMLREGFDLSESEMRKVEPSDLIGTVTYVTIKEKNGTGESADKTYSNVVAGMCERLFEESRAGQQAIGVDLGI